MEEVTEEAGCPHGINIARGGTCEQALVNWSAAEILEACSCTKSDTRQLYVTQQLEDSAKGCTEKQASQQNHSDCG